MKNFRVVYPFIFMAHPNFIWKGEEIFELDIELLFRFYDKDGAEIFTMKDKELFFNDTGISEDVSAPYFVNVYFDEKELYCFELNEENIRNCTSLSKVEIEIYRYGKWFTGKDGYQDYAVITKEEIVSILKNNAEYFNHSDNKAAQTVSFGTVEMTTHNHAVN